MSLIAIIVRFAEFAMVITPELSISNTFNTIRNIGKNTVDLHFSAGYAHRPNTLNVAIDSLDSQSIIHNSQSYQQDINSHHIAACFNTSYEFRLGDHFRFNYGINASANLHGIVTDLDGATNFQLSTFNSHLTNDLCRTSCSEPSPPTAAILRNPSAAARRASSVA